MPKHTNERGHHENVLGWRFDLAINNGAFATSVEMMDAIAYAMNMAREYDEHLAQVNELIDENVKMHKKVNELTAKLGSVEPDPTDWGGDE